jgi:hypothetical protein
VNAERYDEPMYELAEGGSTLRVYPHIAATLDDLLTIEINGPADSVRLSWNDALELSDALRDAIGQGTFKEDALHAAEKRGAVKALRWLAEMYDDERVAELTVRGNVAMAARDRAHLIESGEVTLP